MKILIKKWNSYININVELKERRIAINEKDIS